MESHSKKINIIYCLYNFFTKNLTNGVAGYQCICIWFYKGSQSYQTLEMPVQNHKMLISIHHNQNDQWWWSCWSGYKWMGTIGQGKRWHRGVSACRLSLPYFQSCHHHHHQHHHCLHCHHHHHHHHYQCQQYSKGKYQCKCITLNEYDEFYHDNLRDNHFHIIIPIYKL